MDSMVWLYILKQVHLYFASAGIVIDQLYLYCIQ